jgi:hypothetical protein
MNPSFGADPRIDVAYLFGKFPDLALLERQGLGLDAIGNELVRRKLHKHSRRHKIARLEANEPDQREWLRTKQALRELFCTDNPDFDEIRRRLNQHSGALPPHLLATLSLWLAGFLGMPLTTVTPLVATVLFGIARHGVEGWCGYEEALGA